MRAETPVLETSSLSLRPLEASDAGPIQAIFPRFEIVEFLNAASVPWPYPYDGAQRFVASTLEDMTRGECWYWTIRPREKPELLIGLINLSLGESDNRGFWLDPAWRGRGLMTEAAERVTDYWFDDLGMPLMRVPKAAPNEASRRISISQGMRLVGRGERDFVGGRMPLEIWEISAEEWRARRG